MPCFKGLAVSIHTSDGPLAEHSIQKQQRASRITSYIAVPPPKISDDSLHVEQSTFAISITLLTPGLPVPYSAPKATPDNLYPHSQIVGALPGTTRERGNYGATVAPYVPVLQSPNETIAAYIYFDGRAKEEVATLLRRGEETWVNSRWVSVPESEGGGLAEREFLFREVGLERWLNGLDLKEGQKDIAAILARRKQRLEKKRRKRLETRYGSDDEKDDLLQRARPVERGHILRYGEDKSSPVESLSAEEGMYSDSSSSDDEPVPESSGQIKVCLYRVLASGEIKRGEYSPQFDAHDDDEMVQNGNSGSGDADVDHTTSFAKPKTLDPKTISTQTVTGLDPTEKPYATFTFLYRGEKQLHKMGILRGSEAAEPKPNHVRRKSRQVDFASLKPLKQKSAAGFSGYRDGAQSPDAPNKSSPTKGEDYMDSDDEADAKPIRKTNGLSQDDEIEIEDSNVLLSPEEAARRGELADGVKKIQLKRQHSAEPLSSSSNRQTLGVVTDNASSSTAAAGSITTPGNTALTPSPIDPPATKQEDAFDVGSPFKKARASIAGLPFSSDGVGLNNAEDASATLSSVLGRKSPTPGSEQQNGGAKLEEPKEPGKPSVDSKDGDGDEEL